MPYSQTIARAIAMWQRSMSLPAPVVICLRKISSAHSAAHHHGETGLKIVLGDGVVIAGPEDSTVTPSAMPRGMIVTLCRWIGVIAKCRNENV